MHNDDKKNKEGFLVTIFLSSLPITTFSATISYNIKYLLYVIIKIDLSVLKNIT